ncbi:MAG: FAD-binding protein [Faecalibacterium prausnitzii]
MALTRWTWIRSSQTSDRLSETGLLVFGRVRKMGGILVNAEGKRFCNDLATS